MCPIDPDLINAVKNTLIAGTGILCSKDLLLKIFGPTADLIGDGFRNYTERAARNVNRIIKKMIEINQSVIDAPGEVPPKVIRGLLFEGPFIEDEIAAEYFGGVLASSKTENCWDDRGSVYINLLSSLSTYQIRTHYILYFLLRETFLPYRGVLKPGIDRGMMYIYLPTESYYQTMELGPDFTDPDQKISILAHSMNGMMRLNLVEFQTYGKKDTFTRTGVRYRFPSYPVDEKILAFHGIAFEPSPSGMELFLWAHGLGHLPHQQFLNNEICIKPLSGLDLPKTASVLYQKLLEKKVSNSLK